MVSTRYLGRPRCCCSAASVFATCATNPATGKKELSSGFREPGDRDREGECRGRQGTDGRL